MNASNFFLPYQVKYLLDKSRIKIVEKSRRIGGTYMQSYEDVEDIVTQHEYTPGRPVKAVYFSSKDEDAGREYIEYCQNWAKVFNVAAADPKQEVIDEKKGILATVLRFRNGGKIVSLTSAPTAFNSKGGKIVWDECALHAAQKKMWSGAQPASLWGYPIRILSTHKGTKTLFYQFVTDTKAGKTGWSLHRIPIQRAVEEGLYDKVMGRPTTEEERAAWLEQIRRDCRSEDIWQEDYCCNPVDETTAYIPYELIFGVEADNIIVREELLDKLQGALYAGWDIARSKHLSVFWLLERLGLVNYTRHVKAFDNAPFKIQLMFLNTIMKLQKLRRICVDKTGMGIPLTEQAQEQYGTSRIEGVTFTNTIKEDLAVDVRCALEDRSCRVPIDQQIRASFHSIRKFTTSANNTRYDADATDATGHADHFWAFALANHAAGSKNAGDTWAMSAGSNIYTHQEYGSDYSPSDLRNYD